MSDVLVISIPFILLWKVEIKRRQKIFLGIFLCLSDFMIIIAVIRTTGIPIRKNNVDPVWELFWAEAEASIAVIMVSITAFRSLLGIKALKAREEGTILVGLIPSEKARQISHKVIPKKIQVIRAPIHSKCNLGRDAQIYSRNRVWDEDLRATNYGPHKIKVTRQFLTESEIPNGPASAANFF